MAGTRLDKHISFIGKCVLIEDDFGEYKRVRRILVLADVHLGYEDSVMGFPLRVIFQETFEDLKQVFENVENSNGGGVDLVVLLGDVKHYFGGILDQEWRETRKFFDLLKSYLKKDGRIVVVKGNHDVILEPLSREMGFELKDFFVLGRYGFFHGDRVFQEISAKGIQVLFCGHLHPAVTLREGVKSERYKCFLAGKWKGKRVVVLPSFFPLVEGGDIFYHEGNLGFEFDVKKADVFVVGEKVYEFGKIGKDD